MGRGFGGREQKEPPDRQIWGLNSGEAYQEVASGETRPSPKLPDPRPVMAPSSRPAAQGMIGRAEASQPRSKIAGVHQTFVRPDSCDRSGKVPDLARSTMGHPRELIYPLYAISEIENASKKLVCVERKVRPLRHAIPEHVDRGQEAPLSEPLVVQRGLDRVMR